MAFVGKIVKSAVNIKDKFLIGSIKDVYASQRNTLKKNLEKAAGTAFGKAYQFDRILKSGDIIDQFRNNVPMYNYESIYRDWWHKTLKGERNICWPGRIKYFALSSGTSTASSKQIPISPDMLQSMKRAGIRHFCTLSQLKVPDSFYEKHILLLGGSTQLNRIGKNFEGDLSGILSKNLPGWAYSFYRPGKIIARERDWNTKLQQITSEAQNWDIGVIARVPAWVQILLEKIIDYYKLKHIHEIWPNFMIYAHGGVSFEPYKKGFSKLLGKDIHYMETYLASEGFLAFQKAYGINVMQLVLKNGVFFEFVPFSEDNFTPDGEMKENIYTQTLNEVEENREYAILISTCAGAWRYLIGDTIRFTSAKDYEMVITGRTKHFLSLCGEHLSIDNMNKAIKIVSVEFGIQINEFTVAGIPYNNLFAHKWYVGSNKKIDNGSFRKRLDQVLMELNDDYTTERKAALQEVFVEIIPNSIFYNWMEIKGKMGGQHKFPRVMKNELLNDW
nr:GH3 auxin-responsive promoter family protein [Bacteroidota bacterium]